jgi:hypothetical protein
MIEKIGRIAGVAGIFLCIFISIFIAFKKDRQNWESAVDRAKLTGSMNTIIYFRHKHHEPPASWLLIANQLPGQVPDTDEAVDNLELKARVWESEHYVK